MDLAYPHFGLAQVLGEAESGPSPIGPAMVATRDLSQMRHRRTRCPTRLAPNPVESLQMILQGFGTGPFGCPW